VRTHLRADVSFAQAVTRLLPALPQGFQLGSTVLAMPGQPVALEFIVFDYGLTARHSKSTMAQAVEAALAYRKDKVAHDVAAGEAADRVLSELPEWAHVTPTGSVMKE
jgi:hypothetical protein